jgi:hypothetical protein
MPIFLIARPEHDSIVSYLSCWSEDCLDFARLNSISFHDAKREEANIEEVSKFIQKKDPKLIIFNGHGSPNEIFGDKDEVLINEKNETLLKSRVTYSVSCDSAKDLGKKVVANDGETAFIGYSGPFGFVKDASRECNPRKDKFAEPFKRISNEIILSLLKGKNVGEAHERSQQLCIKLINEYSVSDSKPENKHIRFWLFWDMSFQKALGSQNATFV